MAINVECPACGKVLKAPASAAGKRARCPGCAGVVAVPASPAPSPAFAQQIPVVEPLPPWPAETAPRATSNAATVARAKPAEATDKLSVPCPQCGKTLKAPASMRGKRAKCPGCGGGVAIPAETSEESEEIGLADDVPRAAPPSPSPARPAPPAPAAKPGPSATTTAPAIIASCPQCKSSFSAPAALAGRRVRCPRCSTPISVPERLLDAEAVEPKEDAGEQEEDGDYSLAGEKPGSGLFTDDDFAVAKPAVEPQPDRQPCPKCGEMIAVGAAKCRFCNSIFDSTLRKAEEKKNKKKAKSGGSSQPASVVGGIATMVLAVIWFVGGIVWLDRIFIWPPIMFVGGLVTFFKGCFRVADEG